MNRIITLTTDFGLQDGYVGAMKGVILSINPEATIVDITHEIAPQNIEQGAFLFAATYRYFPENTIHVVVVDPGVGGARRPIAAQVGKTAFVGPDNGVLARAIGQGKEFAQEGNSVLEVVHLNRPEYWLPEISHTFHGRDVFAPVAGHLSLGVPLKALGEEIRDWVRLSSVSPTRREDGALVTDVIHIDHFGNVVINVARGDLKDIKNDKLVIKIANQQIHGLNKSYSDVASGQPVALFGSSGYLEVGIRDGSAARSFGIHLGDRVILVP